MTKTIALRPMPKTKEEFIASAAAENEVKTEINTELTEKSIIETEKHFSENSVQVDSKKREVDNIKRTTIYLPREIHIAWKKYELDQLEKGVYISFQKIVVSQLKNLLKDFLK
jgi:hypothetical protein